MESTVTLSRKERRKAEQALESLPVVPSGTPESIEGTDDTTTTEALKSAPTASLPTAPVTTGSLPITMPVAQVQEPEADAVSDAIESDVDGVSAADPIEEAVEDGEAIVVRKGVELWDDTDLAGVEFETSGVRSVEDIMAQDGVGRNEALLIQQDEEAVEREASWKAESEARVAAQSLREAREAEQAQAARLAEQAKVERVKAQARAEDRYKGHKRRGIIFLIVAVLFTTAFFFLGGL